jgi:hypothetical protein
MPLQRSSIVVLGRSSIVVLERKDYITTIYEAVPLQRSDPFYGLLLSFAQQIGMSEYPLPEVYLLPHNPDDGDLRTTLGVYTLRRDIYVCIDPLATCLFPRRLLAKILSHELCHWRQDCIGHEKYSRFVLFRELDATIRSFYWRLRYRRIFKSCAEIIWQSKVPWYGSS